MNTLFSPRENALTRNTNWPTPTHHGGLIRSMEEIQGDQQRTNQCWDQNDRFFYKAEPSPISKRRMRRG